MKGIVVVPWEEEHGSAVACAPGHRLLWATSCLLACAWPV